MAAMQTLKDIPVAVQSGKLTVRKKVFEQLDEITKKNVEPQILKAVCKLLQMTLPRYDRKSTKIVDNFVKNLVQHQASIPYLIKAIGDVADMYKNIYSTKAVAQVCNATLSWSCHVASEVFGKSEKNNEEIQSLLQSQALLLFCITGAQSKFLNQKAYCYMLKLWRKDVKIIEEYLSCLRNVAESHSSLIFIAFFVKYLVEVKQKDKIKEIKEHAIHVLCRIVIGSKTKPSSHIIDSCHSLLRQITHDEFQCLVLPSIQKALLRNPEIIFETISSILSSVSLDLSQYALELGKSIGVHLHSKEDQCREAAVSASKCLAQQCSSSQDVRDVLQHFFNILNGSEGKLTVVTQRIGVLSGIGNLSYNIVTGSSSIQSLCEFAVDNFINVLKHEVHEGTITHTISMLSLWCAKFTTEVPKNLMDLFKDGLTQKNSVTAVRNSYVLCMHFAFHGNTLHQGLDMIPLLEKTYNKALAQPSQIPAVVEALSTFCLFLKLYTIDAEAESKLRNVMNIEINKLPFLLEKFLSCCSNEALLSVMYMIERLVLDHGQKLVDNADLLKKAVLYVLTRPDYKVRTQAASHLKKMLSALGGTSLACSLLQEFPSFVNNLKVKRPEKNENESESTEVNLHILLSSLLTLCSGSNLDESDVKELCIQSLIPSHLDLIYLSQPHVWTKMVSKLKVVPEEFLLNNKDSIVSHLMEDGDTTELVAKAKLNSLKTLVLLQPKVYVPEIVAKTVDVLKDASFVQITKEEYNIYLTPEGHLYDTSVIENLKEHTNSNKNIKRESKLYSYKEQMEEIELKKEIEAKKRAKGLVKEPELSRKQLEAKKLQLEKEALIRVKLKELDIQYENAMDKLQAILDVKPVSLGMYIKDLTSLLISLFSSPLCAFRATRMFVNLSSVVSAGILSLWSKPVAFTTLRMLKAECELEPAWTEVNLDEIVLKIIHFLYSNTCQIAVGSYDEHLLSQTAQNHLSAPGFSFCFPLMQHLLLTRSSDMTLVEQILCIISEHLDIREEDQSTDQVYQECVPTIQLFDILIKVICLTTGQNQKLAMATLVKASEAASGDEDCSFATMEEINVLLLALLLNEEQARLAALQGLKALEIVLPHPDSDTDSYIDAMHVVQRVFVACFDPVEKNAAVAQELWQILNYSKNPDLCELILGDIIYKEVLVRQAAANALADLFTEFPQHLQSTIEKLLANSCASCY